MVFDRIVKNLFDFFIAFRSKIRFKNLKPGRSFAHFAYFAYFAYFARFAFVQTYLGNIFKLKDS